MGSVEIDVVNKNFLNISNKLDGTLNGITTTTNVNGSIHISGTTTGAGALFKGARIKVGKLKAGTYSFSAKLTGKSGTTFANSALYFRPSYNGKPYAEMHPYANGSVYNNNVTLSSETEIWLEWYCNTSGISIDADLFLQIEQSTAKTDWGANSSQTAIMPIQQEMLEGDYVEDVEHHEWKKIVLDGTENWSETTTNNLKRFFCEVSVVSINDNNSVNCISNYFKGTSRNKLEHSNGDEISVSDKYLNILSKNIKTKEDFKAWLKSKYDEGNPVVVYYKLATPLNLELTEGQKAIRDTKLYTYKNITNIAVSDELASVEVEYKKDQDTINKNYENRLAALEAASIS